VVTQAGAAVVLARGRAEAAHLSSAVAPDS